APLVFRRVLPSHLFFYLGGSFFLCRRELISRRHSLAILAHPIFQLLYDPVANGSIHVVFGLFRRNRTHNSKLLLFSGVGV
ncbi:hypothetical protein, partial [Pseudomonas sp. FG-3G]